MGHHVVASPLLLLHQHHPLHHHRHRQEEFRGSHPLPQRMSCARPLTLLLLLSTTLLLRLLLLMPAQPVPCPEQLPWQQLQQPRQPQYQHPR